MYETALYFVDLDSYSWFRRFSLDIVFDVDFDVGGEGVEPEIDEQFSAGRVYHDYVTWVRDFGTLEVEIALLLNFGQELIQAEMGVGCRGG